MKSLLLFGLIFPAFAYSQVSYTVTVTRLKAKADDCDGGIITLCGNAPQDPVYNIWSNDAEANENTYCWIFDNDPEAEYNLWKDIQNVELANETNVLTDYITFDMAGYESDGIDPGCTSTFIDEAVEDRQFVQQIDLSNLTEGGAENLMVINLSDIYYAEIIITWIDLTASLNTIVASELKIAPNPSNGMFQLNFNSPDSRQVTVLDMSGRVVFSEQVEEQTRVMNLTGFDAGTYFVNVTKGSDTYSVKLMLN